jgi:hypothetical protein
MPGHLGGKIAPRHPNGAADAVLRQTHCPQHMACEVHAEPLDTAMGASIEA